MVLDPLAIPPLRRVDVRVAHQDGEVQVVSAREPRIARTAEEAVLLDQVALGDVDLREMAVQRDEAEPVVEQHALAVDAELAGEQHAPAIRRLDRRPGGGGEVVAVVDRLGDLHVLRLADPVEDATGDLLGVQLAAQEVGRAVIVDDEAPETLRVNRAVNRAGIARRDFSMQVKEKMLLAGFVVLMTLMVTVIYNDLTRISWLERLMPWRN